MGSGGEHKEANAPALGIGMSAGNFKYYEIGQIICGKGGKFFTGGTPVPLPRRPLLKKP